MEKQNRAQEGLMPLLFSTFRFGREERLIRDADERFMKVMGYTKEEVEAGIRIEQIFGQKDRFLFDGILKRDDVSIEESGIRCTIQKKDQSMETAILLFSPIKKVNGRIEFLCTMALLGIKDVQNRNEENLRRQKEQILELKEAIDRAELDMRIQPQYSLLSGKLAGGEILTKWKRNDRDMMPEEFLPYLEEAQVAAELDFYVLIRVLRQMGEWRSKGYERIPISFNLSTQHFQMQGFVERMAGLAEAYEIPCSDIILEIREGIFIKMGSEMDAILDNMRSYGFSIAMDHFAGQYESFHILEKKMVDLVKLDRKILKYDLCSLVGRTMIGHLIHIAQLCGLDTVCVGVETEEQRKMLAECGAQKVQGYLYEHPMELEEFERKYLRKEVY